MSVRGLQSPCTGFGVPRLVRAYQSAELWGELCRSVVGDGGGEAINVKRSRRTVRVALADGRSVVVKVWRREKWPAFVYAAGFRGTTAYREWRIPQLLARRGVPAARSLAYFSFVETGGGVGEAVVLEDLGECRSPMKQIKAHAAAGEDGEVEAFEARLVDVTAGFIQNGFLDTDHGLANFAVTPSGDLVRLDFEHCRHFPMGLHRFARGMYGRMLGLLVGTYAFAVQPRTELAVRLGEGLAERLRPPRAVLRRAAGVVDGMMAKQLREGGIQSRVELPW